MRVGVPQELLGQDEPDWLRKSASSNYIPSAKELWEDCLFYPSSGSDGRPVQCLAGLAHSFVYVDYGFTPEDLAHAHRETGFKGYTCVRSANLDPSILDEIKKSESYLLHLRGNPERGKMASYLSWWAKEKFGKWMLFKRDVGYDRGHGPEYFSFTFICAEAVSTYGAMCLKTQTCPRALAIIQPGHGFGGNWTNFEDPKAIFAKLVHDGQGQPDYLVCGGYGHGFNSSFWPDTYSVPVAYLLTDEGNSLWARPDGQYITSTGFS